MLISILHARAEEAGRVVIGVDPRNTSTTHHACGRPGERDQDSGSPDLGDRAWDPFWEVCSGLGLPVHFHIGASQTSLSYFGSSYWPSQDEYVKPAIGGASLFQNNSRLLLNSAYSGMFDRYPALQMVSVESDIGWIPFMLEAMDHEGGSPVSAPRPGARSWGPTPPPSTASSRWSGDPGPVTGIR